MQKAARDSKHADAPALADDRAALAEGLDRAEGDRTATSSKGSWRSHQVPFADVRDNPAHLKLLEDWMRSYKPEELFDADGTLVPELRALAPDGRSAHERQPARQRRPAAQGPQAARLPRSTPSTVATRGTTQYENTKPLGEFLRDVMKQQPDQLPRLRPRRDRVEPAAGRLRSEQEDLDGRHAARGRRRRRARARRPRDGDALASTR